MGERIVRFFEIRAETQDSAVDAGLGFAVKERAVLETLEHQPIFDAVDHFASLRAGGIKTEVHQDDESVEGEHHDAVIFREVGAEAG